MIKQIKHELAKFLSILKFEDEVLQPDQVKISERAVGGKVELVAGDGTLTPAPDGNYKVDDFEFSVKDGLISEIKDEAKEEFEDVTALQIGDEVNINPDAKEYMPWYEGVGFVVNSLDGHGEGFVGLANSKGFYVAYTSSASVTKTGNKVELPKDEQFAEVPPEDNSELKSAIESIKAETEALKGEIEAIKALISELAGKSDVEEFKSEIVKLNQTLEAVAKIPATFSKTDKNPIISEKNENSIEALTNLMLKK